MAQTNVNVNDPICMRNVGKNATFELSLLKLPKQQNFPYYRVKDSGPGNYTYFFNICGQVNKVPCQVNPQQANGSCPHIVANESCITQPIADPAIAYQYRPKNSKNELGNIDQYERCYRVSGNDPAVDTTWSFLDSNNPARGVTITFTGGDYCGGAHANRELVLGLICANDAINVPDKEFAQEFPAGSCVYSLNFTSIHGCPVECGRTNGRLCNEAGLCDYDWTARTPKCFCYDGYSGHECKDIVPKTDPAQIQPPPLSNCMWKTKAKNATVAYDLKVFDRINAKQPFFKVHDTDAEQGRHFDYYFNFCSDIPRNKLPHNCSVPLKGPCVDVSKPCNGSNTPMLANTGIGFQTDIHDTCYLIGQKTAPKYSLFDPQDPTRGIVVEYGSGQYCGGGKNRTLRIALRCPDSTRAFFKPREQTIINETVAEQFLCEYSLTYETAYACPFQCRKETPQGVTVCSGKGICAADPELGFVRCLCDDGYTGLYCDSVVKPHVLPPTIIKDDGGDEPDVGLIVGIVIMALVVLLCAGGIYYQWKKASEADERLRRILDDNGSDEEDGIGNPTDDVRMPGRFDEDEDDEL